mgnify:CR=1 FL=1
MFLFSFLGKIGFYFVVAYLIIFMFYLRDRIEKKLDNNIDFINSLKSKGFTIFENSKSNYNRTVLSLVSTMNFEFLDYNVSEKNIHLSSDSLKHSLDNNKVFEYLFNKGYSIYLHLWIDLKWKSIDKNR